MKHLFHIIALFTILSVLASCQKEDTFQIQQERAAILGTYALNEICLLPSSESNIRIAKQKTENWTLSADPNDLRKIYFQELGIYGVVKGHLVDIPSQTLEGLQITIAGYGHVVSEELHLYYAMTDHILDYTKTCEVHGLKMSQDFMD